MRVRGGQAELGGPRLDGGRRLRLADLEEERLALGLEHLELGLEPLHLVAGAGDPARLGQVQRASRADTTMTTSASDRPAARRRDEARRSR